jgi:hypothetical protein
MALAARFVGLGVILGVFELADPWEGRAGEEHRDMQGPAERVDGLRFRLKGPRPPEAIEGYVDRAEMRGRRRHAPPEAPIYAPGGSYSTNFYVLPRRDLVLVLME